MLKRDMKDAFRMIPIAPQYHWLMGFFWDGRFYVEQVLSFGLRTAPIVFNRGRPSQRLDDNPRSTTTGRSTLILRLRCSIRLRLLSAHLVFRCFFQTRVEQGVQTPYSSARPTFDGGMTSSPLSMACGSSTIAIAESYTYSQEWGRSTSTT
jgi:hypothetical protein